MAKTLQDYILCNVSQNEVRQFQKVLAKNPITGASSDDMASLLEKYYNAKDSGVWNKIFGPDSDPFDMTAEELERLGRVHRDPSQQIEFSLPLEGKGPKELSKIQTTVNRFMLKNSVYFDSFKDVFVDTEEKELNFSGRKELAEELLKELKYTDAEIKKIFKGGYERYGFKKQPSYFFPLSTFGDPQVFTRPHVSLTISKFLKDMQKQKKKDQENFILRSEIQGKKNNPNANPAIGVYFEGPVPIFERFLGPEGLNLPKAKTEEILKNLSKYKA